jgi:phosphopantetheine--protein transferase-like protein
MIGIDIISTSRFKNKKKSFLEKVFSSKELEESKENHEKLAGKWAAKEAAFKAGLNYANHDIEVLTENKKPFLFIKGHKSEAMLSISHEKTYATAVVFNNAQSF